MDAFEKLKTAAPYLHLEIDQEAPGGRPAHAAQSSGLPIADVCLPNGKTMPILKAMLTTVCENNCIYCAFRSGRDCHRTTFQPSELAGVIDQLWRKGLVAGVMLSSGVAGSGANTQDRLLAAASILRGKLDFRGYLHYKLMPGVERVQVEAAMRLADRVSLNLESPNPYRLARLAPNKEFTTQLLEPLAWMNEMRSAPPSPANWKGKWPSTSTQFVIGAVGESDLEIMQTSSYLYKQLHLARVYYSRFQPVPGTPLGGFAETPLNRQTRLYQASFLLRDYSFGFEELPFSPNGSLPADQDPKLAWAKENLKSEPVEINRASREELLRVPGIGPKRASSILIARREDRIRSVDELQALGIPLQSASPFLQINGKRPVYQPALW